MNFYKTDIALAVHVSDLLSKSGILDEFDDGYFFSTKSLWIRETLTLRDRFVLDYGDLAIANQQIAYAAFVYWKSVPPHGIWRLEEVQPIEFS